MGRVFASLVVRAAGMNVEGTAKPRDSPQEAWGHGAAAIELHRVGRIRQRLQR
ncbi:hypothetical protein [Pectobacterium brasiliense]|uniref:hypothetical protein n=1 Tax=Pectobacterium brasiliense TaxID=180957 RepID=UPI001F2CE4A9|nr:hypothetical protein [Pectobacterium brasiliense]